jgi:hypothetical protein
MDVSIIVLIIMMITFPFCVGCYAYREGKIAGVLEEQEKHISEEANRVNPIIR